MSDYSLIGQTVLLCVAISRAGVTLRRVTGDDDFVRWMLGEEQAGRPAVPVVASGFFFTWLLDSAGKRAGVDAMLDLETLTDEDRAVVQAAGQCITPYSLVVHFSTDADLTMELGTDCLSTLVRHNGNLELRLVDNAYVVVDGEIVTVG